MGQQSNLYQRGRVWWIRYRVDGRQHRESTRSTRKADATALLRQRLAEVAQGSFVGNAADRFRVGRFLARDKAEPGTLVAMLMSHYRRMSSYERAESALRCHVTRHFGDWKVKALRLDRLMQYLDDRRDEGAKVFTRKKVRIASIRTPATGATSMVVPPACRPLARAVAPRPVAVPPSA